jgi:probable addiction module antidote protein
MKKREKIDLEITLEDVKIPKEDFAEYYANFLKKRPSELKSYKKHIIQEYNKTKDVALFLEGLKIVAKAEGNVSKLAKNTGMDRTSIYKLSRKANPSFCTIVALAHNLGMDFRLSVASK